MAVCHQPPEQGPKPTLPLEASPEQGPRLALPLEASPGPATGALADATGTEASLGRKWRSVEVAHGDFRASVPICFQHEHLAQGVWEFRSFFFWVMSSKAEIHHWLDRSGTHGKRGHWKVTRFMERMQADSKVCCKWWPSSKQDKASSFGEYMCSAGYLLLLNLDQHGPGWSMAHFLEDEPPRGMGLMVDFEGDFFHRSANDFNWARDHADGFHRETNIQMFHVFNANFGPWVTGANILKKQETLEVIRRCLPQPPPEIA